MVRPSGKAQRGYGSAGGEGMRLGCEVKAETLLQGSGKRVRFKGEGRIRAKVGRSRVGLGIEGRAGNQR